MRLAPEGLSEGVPARRTPTLRAALSFARSDPLLTPHRCSYKARPALHRGWAWWAGICPEPGWMASIRCGTAGPLLTSFSGTKYHMVSFGQRVRGVLRRHGVMRRGSMASSRDGGWRVSLARNRAVGPPLAHMLPVGTSVPFGSVSSHLHQPKLPGMLPWMSAFRYCVAACSSLKAHRVPNHAAPKGDTRPGCIASGHGSLCWWHPHLPVTRHCLAGVVTGDEAVVACAISRQNRAASRITELQVSNRQPTLAQSFGSTKRKQQCSWLVPCARPRPSRVPMACPLL